MAVVTPIGSSIIIELDDTSYEQLQQLAWDLGVKVEELASDLLAEQLSRHRGC